MSRKLIVLTVFYPCIFEPECDPRPYGGQCFPLITQLETGYSVQGACLWKRPNGTVKMPDSLRWAPPLRGRSQRATLGAPCFASTDCWRLSICARCSSRWWPRPSSFPTVRGSPFHHPPRLDFDNAFVFTCSPISHPPSDLTTSPLSLDEPSTSPWSLSLVLRPITLSLDLPTLPRRPQLLIPSKFTQLASTTHACARVHSFHRRCSASFLTRPTSLLRTCSSFDAS